MALSYYEKKWNTLTKNMKANGFNDRDTLLVAHYIFSVPATVEKDEMINLCVKNKFMQELKLIEINSHPEIRANLLKFINQEMGTTFE